MAILLVRHASAGDREAWRGDDSRRPLDERGEREAEALPELLKDFDVQRVLCSPSLRCVQTVEPLARRRGLSLEERPELGEGSRREAVLALLDELGDAAVLCTHGDVIMQLLGRETPKGSTTVLERSVGGVVHSAYLPPGG